MRYNKKTILKEAGQTLLEVMLAFTVSVMVLSAVIFGITTSLSDTQYTKNKNLATSYAQEGMAVVRQIRDSGWNDLFTLEDFFKTNTIYCLDQDSVDPDPREITETVLNCDKNVGIFSREVRFDHEADECCSNKDPACVGGSKGSKATVRVSWADNKCPSGASNPFCHSVELVTCFSSVDLKEAP